MNFEDRYSVLKNNSSKNRICDVNHALRYTRWFLTIIGIWPYVISNPTSLERYVSKFILPISSIFMLIVVIHLILHVIMREINRSELLVLIGPIGFQITNVLKHFVLVMRTDSIKKCIEHMKNDWRIWRSKNDRRIMMKNLRNGNEMTIICATFMYSGAIFYHAIMPFWTKNIINDFNETVRPLAYPGADIFIDLRNGYNYEIIFCTICISSFFLYSVVTSTCNLAAVFVTHACGQIQLIMSRLENLLNTEDEKIIDNVVVAYRMAFIIRFHVRVLKFSTQINQVLREICLLEVVASTILICLLEYYCVTEWNNSDSVAILTYVVLLISLSFNIFIYCHIGELLTNQCHQVGNAAYNLEWYRLPGKTGLALVMIITMANYPPKLTAGSMIELSIDTFATIMRTSITYLNMLRKVTD